CLVQALLVQHFLKRKGIATTLYLGVNKDKQDHLMAHAWVRCGEMIVTGQYEKDHFIEVAKFSNESLI
ncbi:MAG: lasso peptide biosynthesis B2 protein, partial [Streptococcus salivarius]